MNWEDLSQPTRDAMEKLGNFGPTVRPCDREIKGTMYNVDSECVESTYHNSDDLRQLAAACNEVAEWLDNRAIGRTEIDTKKEIKCWGQGQFVVVAMFRYCLYRQTYVVQECADWLLLHWPVIEQPARNLIRRELERAFDRDNEARAGDAKGYKPLWCDCDRRQWERVRSLWANK